MKSSFFLARWIAAVWIGRFQAITVVCVVGIVTLLSLDLARAQGTTLEYIRDRDTVRCIVEPNTTGFSYRDDQGRMVGFNVDFCRAVAAAILGDAEKVELVPTSPIERFTVLASRNADLLSRSSSKTLSRDTKLGLNFLVTTYYSGQAFLVRSRDNLRQLADLNHGTICIPSGTTLEGNLNDYARQNNLVFEMLSQEQTEDALMAFTQERCDAFSADSSYLAATMSTLPASTYAILPDIISKEPLTIAVREGDTRFAQAIRWIIYGLIAAEEQGVSQSNIADLMQRQNLPPDTRRLLGLEGGLGTKLGLSDHFVRDAVAQVGNYGDIFDRHLAPLGLPRGLNSLARDGGLMYSPPFR